MRKLLICLVNGLVLSHSVKAGSRVCDVLMHTRYFFSPTATILPPLLSFFYNDEKVNWERGFRENRLKQCRHRSHQSRGVTITVRMRKTHFREVRFQIPPPIVRSSPLYNKSRCTYKKTTNFLYCYQLGLFILL